MGREIGIELAKRGCKIAVADVDINGAIETVEDLRLLGVKAFAYEVTINISTSEVQCTIVRFYISIIF